MVERGEDIQATSGLNGEKYSSLDFQRPKVNTFSGH